MKWYKNIMGMPVLVEIAQSANNPITKCKKDVEKVFKYLRYVDETFSTYKKNSDISKINRGELSHKDYSKDIKFILEKSEETKKLTNGYFDIKKPDGTIDPSGIVKGWAIKTAADMLRKNGYKSFFVDIAGDAEIVGKNWKWGIRNPFKKDEIVKVLKLSNCGIATSGTSERGMHIWNPKTKNNQFTDIISITVIAKNVFEADRFATAAFAMGHEGINFLERYNGLEGYMIGKDGIATMTTDFEKYIW